MLSGSIPSVDSMNFTLTKEQHDKLRAWIEENKFHEIYTGAIGGGLTYQFSPTSIGCAVNVYWMIGTKSEKSIDLSDYENW